MVAVDPGRSPDSQEREPTYAYRPALDGVRALAVAGVLFFRGGVAFLPGGRPHDGAPRGGRALFPGRASVALTEPRW